MARKRGRRFRITGAVIWGTHMALARLGVYRCPRCKGRLNYRWWCHNCQGYRLPAR